MKPLTLNSFSFSGRTLLASAVACLLGTAAWAQSSTPSNSSSNDQYNSSRSSNSDRSQRDPSTMSNSSGDSATAATDSSSSGSMSHRSSDKLGWSDRHFVTKTAEGNQDEIQLAQLAAERSSNADVKSFAQKLIDDHTKMGSELESIASSKNVKVDKTSGQSRTYKRLSKASGNDFDREFVENMIDEHEKDIKSFKDRADDAKDPELKQFAQSHLAALQEHLQMAQNLRNSIVPTGRDDKTSGRGNMESSTDKSTTTSTNGATSTSTTGTATSTTSAIDSGTTGSATTNSGSTSSDSKRGGGK